MGIGKCIFVALVACTFSPAIFAADPGAGIAGQPYDPLGAFEQVPLSGLNTSDTSPAKRQATGRCFTSSGERFDCANPTIDSCCNNAVNKGCCDGTKKTKCVTQRNGDAICCWNDSTQCGTTCCIAGYTCCNSGGVGECCDNYLQQCCGTSCCANNRQCCAGTCCPVGFECSNGRSCARRTTAVLTVTSTRVVAAGSTNEAVARKGARKGFVEAVGVVVVAAAGMV